jgi:hypothetical protein
MAFLQNVEKSPNSSGLTEHNLPMNNELKGVGDKLYIGEKEVLHGWESFTGWYWFATENTGIDYNGKPIWFGLVQGMYEEWGEFPEAEIDSLGMKAWKINKIDLPYSGRRN